MTRFVQTLLVLLTVMAAWPARATALERLCDTAYEDCRAPILQLIANETRGVDVAFWFMEDARYSAELARAAARGVRIRVIFDTLALNDDPHGIRHFVVNQLVTAQIPMRRKTTIGINHWKFMLFDAQNTVQFSGANYSDEAFVPQTPYTNYVDEVVYFTHRTSIVNSFRTMFDNVWTDTGGTMADYANVTALERVHPTSPIDPEMNFSPFENFRWRSVERYNAETQRIDALMYRITDRWHTDTLIEAVKRGVAVRLVSEPHQYRDPSRLWHSWNIDRLWLAGQQHQLDVGGAVRPGIEVRHRRHLGLMHEKLTILAGQRMSIFGSSNWTSPSADTQLEHNLFTTDEAVFAWTRNHFDRKWFNLGPAPETQPFVPLPPDVPRLVFPAPGAVNQSATLAFLWDGGAWAHRYDVYLGTDPSNMTAVVADLEMGPYGQALAVVQALSAGTTYYWRVVGRTMANLSRSTAICSFRTAGSGTGPTPSATCLAAPPQPADPVLVNAPQDVAQPPPATPTPPPTTGGSTPPPPTGPSDTPSGGDPDGGVDTSGSSNDGSPVPASRRVPTSNGVYTGGTAIRR